MGNEDNKYPNKRTYNTYTQVDVKYDAEGIPIEVIVSNIHGVFHFVHLSEFPDRVLIGGMRKAISEARTLLHTIDVTLDSASRGIGNG